MVPGSSLIEHKRLFDGLAKSLAAMGKIMDTEDLVVIYANSLPPAEYGTWLQRLSSTLETISLSAFKGRVREEEHANEEHANEERRFSRRWHMSHGPLWSTQYRQ